MDTNESTNRWFKVVILAGHFKVKLLHCPSILPLQKAFVERRYQHPQRDYCHDNPIKQTKVSIGINALVREKYFNYTY